MGRTTASIKLADEVWIATALLHRERPEAADFTMKEIEMRLERFTEGRRAGVQPHLSVHCVANRPPKGGRYRMLFETAPGRRRLFRRGDPYHPAREGGKIVPRRDEVPSKYHSLLDAYERESATVPEGDPLLALATRQRGLWKSVDPDDYVRGLREGFE